MWASKHAAVGLDATAKVLRQLKELSQWKPVGAAQAAFTKIKSNDFYHMLKGLDNDGMLPILTFSFDCRNCERLAGKYQAGYATYHPLFTCRRTA